MLVSRVRGRHHNSSASSCFFLLADFLGFAAVLVFFELVFGLAAVDRVRFCVFLGGSGTGSDAAGRADERPRSLALRRSVLVATVLIAETAVIAGRFGSCIRLWLEPKTEASIVVARSQNEMFLRAEDCDKRMRGRG